MIINGKSQRMEDHIKHDLIRIAIRNHPGQGASTCHAKTAGVVNDDQIGAALLDEFG